MENTKELEEKFLEFMEELTKISNKYGFGIWGCGCCGSPFIVKLKPNKEYVYDYYVGKYEDGISITEVLIKNKPGKLEDFRLETISVQSDIEAVLEGDWGSWKQVTHGSNESDWED